MTFLDWEHQHLIMKPSFPFLQLHFVLSTTTRNLDLYFFFPFPFLIYAHPRISLLSFFFFWLRIPFIFNLSKFPFLPNFYVFFWSNFFFLAPFQYFFSKKLIKATFQPKREDRQKRKSCIKKRGLK